MTVEGSAADEPDRCDQAQGGGTSGGGRGMLEHHHRRQSNEVEGQQQQQHHQKAAREENQFTEMKLTANSNDDTDQCDAVINRILANGRSDSIRRASSSTSFKKIKDDYPTSPRPPAQDKPGKFRHIVAILALSSIFLANMNRQAYNQALSRMVRSSSNKLPTPATTDDQQLANTTLGPSYTILNTEGDILDYNSATTTTLPLLANDDDDDHVTTEPSIVGGDTDHSSNFNDVFVNDDEQPNQPLTEADDDLFDWDLKQISLLQAAFSWGYMPFMIPGGRLSEIYGAKWIIFLSGFGSAICSILTPFLAEYSFSLLLGSRILMGICQTGVSPALYALLTRWMTPDESSVYLAMIKVGVMFGFMAGSFINGFLSWRMTFYSVGFISILWSIMWAFCVTSTPDEHKWLGADELAYIKRSIGLDLEVCDHNENAGTKKAETKMKKKKQSDSAPWIKIITSPVVLAFMLTKFTVKLSTDTQSMQVPMYLKNVMRVSDKLNGALNGANFAIQAIFTGMVAYLAKEMIVRQSFGMDKTSVRKLFQAVQNFGMGLGYVLIALNKDSLSLVCCAVMLISITSMFGSGGEAVLPVDLTRKYSASIMAIANSVANLSGILLPSMVSFLLNNQLADPDSWAYVWWVINGLMMVGGMTFLLFVNARIQDFDDDNDDSRNNKNEVLTIGKKSVLRKTSQSVVIEMNSKVRLKGFDED